MKRPFSVTIVLVLVLSLTVWSALRLSAGIRWWGTLKTYTAPGWPMYITVSAGIWFVIGGALLWGIWRRKVWARYALIGTGAGFIVWYWCDRLFVQWPRENWSFALCASILYVIAGIACFIHPKTKIYFQRETHDR